MRTTLVLSVLLAFGCGVGAQTSNRLAAEELAPVDLATTDEERARYGIASLSKLLQTYPEQKVACTAPGK